MQSSTETFAYNVGQDIRLRFDNNLVCYDLFLKRWLVFGKPGILLGLKIQATKIRDWLLTDQLVAEAIQRGDKEIGVLEPEDRQTPIPVVLAIFPAAVHP
jgi:hypothetical protein